MQEGFDPYLHWLGIRDPKRPPNHYRLLGIELFESEPDVISNAVDRQMAHVRTFQAGPRSVESQRILNELAGAKICLLNADKKAAYDAKLQGELRARAVPPIAEDRNSAPAVPHPTVRMPGRRAERLAVLWVVASVLVATGVVLTALLVLVVGGRESRDGARPEGAEETVAPTIQTKPDATVRPSALGAADPATEQQPPKSAGLQKPELAKPPSTGSPEATSQGPESAGRPSTESAAGSKTPNNPMSTASINGKSGTDPQPPPVRLPQPPRSMEAPGKATQQRAPASTPRLSPAGTVGRLPIPDDAAQAAAQGKVDDVFKGRVVQAKSPADKGLLAGELIRQAKETKDNPAARYVLLAEARDLAVAGGDPARLREAVSEMARAYEVDAIQEQARVLTEAAERALPSLVKNSLARAAIGLCQEAIQADAFEAASQSAKAGFSLAGKVMASKGRDPQMIQQSRELVEIIPWYQQQFGLAQEAEKTLAQDPANPKAILFLGKYYALVKNQWSRGLPLLAKGGDPTLKSLAAAEMALGPSTDAADLVKLADQWKEVVPSLDPPWQRFAQHRALHWYEDALPRLRGFAQTRVARLVLELKEAESPRRKL
jgi:hypothetical protein